MKRRRRSEAADAAIAHSNENLKKKSENQVKEIIIEKHSLKNPLSSTPKINTENLDIKVNYIYISIYILQTLRITRLIEADEKQRLGESYNTEGVRQKHTYTIDHKNEQGKLLTPYMIVNKKYSQYAPTGRYGQ